MTSQLHILFLCSWYPSKVFPTNGDFIQRHAQAVGVKHLVSVFHIVSNPDVKKTTIEKMVNSNVTEFIAYVKPSSFFLIKWMRFWKAYELLLSEVKEINVVHVHRLYPMGICALLLKKKLNLNYIITEHWTGYHFTESNPISWFESFFSKRIAKNAHAICPVSNDLQRSMEKNGLHGNYVPIPNVVNTSLFKPDKQKKNGFTICHISDLNDDHKNISGMIRVAAKVSKLIPNTTWNFIGGKSDNYKTLLSHLNLEKIKLNFVDHVSHKEVCRFLNEADVFVLFSNYENLPCVILESFSAGTPVISTDVGGIKEFFPKEFGYLIEPNNEQELLQKLIQIHKDPKPNPEEMHTYAETHFSPEKICDSFTKLYLQIQK